MKHDVIVIGAGGAGLMCAIHAGRRSRQVLVLDHSPKLGGKILISGGGRCNFTNLGASPAQYVSRNPHFCKSALSRYRPESFIQMVRDHGIAFHEKKLGQQFCDRSAQEIVQMLKIECDRAGAVIRLGCKIQAIQQTGSAEEGSGFSVQTDSGGFECESLVVATGGLSIPKIGATGLGYRIAEQFGLKRVETAPALDGFVFGDRDTIAFRQLSGLSIDCVISCNGMRFRENILFTHSGLSGPAALQASLHWHPGEVVEVNLLPEIDSFAWFMQKKKEGNRSIVRNLLAELLPARFSELFCDLFFPSGSQAALPLPQVSEKLLEEFCSRLHAWTFIPNGTMGYGKAEVTRGGVDTDEISSKTFEAKKIPGLYFIGEVLDVTGWLGGYNFQWAWASGWAAGQCV